MRVDNLGLDERVHVLDSHTNVWTVIDQITNSGAQEDAFYVCDVGDIVRKHKAWTDTMPRVKPFYAVKCNDNLPVLKVLAALGTGFDCASKVEINKVLSLGVQPDRIIFANPSKPNSHIRHAAAMGIDLMTFDNESELYKVKDMFADARMVIRIRQNAAICQCSMGMKFGCNAITEAPRLLEVARGLGVNVVGVSFHVGSDCKDPPVYRKAIAAARNIFDIAKTLGFDFNLLDLGGGYPGDFGTSIVRIAEIINVALDDYFPDPSVDVIAEPGRYYVSSAYTLACSVHSMRSFNTDGPCGQTEKHFMYYINDGIYGRFTCIPYNHQRVCAHPLKEYPNSELFSSSVWGPTCAGHDQVLLDLLLPQMQLGDWLVFENMGAYTLPLATSFNGFPIPKVHVVVNETVWLLLKDLLPLTEDHFIIGSKRPDRLGMEASEREPWSLPKMLITIPVRGGRWRSTFWSWWKSVNSRRKTEILEHPI